ncbi:hypothetical protein F2Q68_00011950 [Brassica cretica]|uniref:Uncharacterized protein n=1 Tax=Brassica cretica TaxID=69181 RepID=A0A8S9L0W2_BRACR|nr:hypothetical protein F2Q68_00011950 [Brassica cretica]
MLGYGPKPPDNTKKFDCTNLMCSPSALIGHVKVCKNTCLFFRIIPRLGSICRSVLRFDYYTPGSSPDYGRRDRRPPSTDAKAELMKKEEGV